MLPTYMKNIAGKFGISTYLPIQKKRLAKDHRFIFFYTLSELFELRPKPHTKNNLYNNNHAVLNDVR